MILIRISMEIDSVQLREHVRHVQTTVRQQLQ